MDRPCIINSRKNSLMINPENKNTPKVTVVMSVYNGEAHIHEAIGSILGQTMTDWEFLIVDDGSTDDTATILKHYASNDCRFKIVKNTNNIGLTKSLNRGIKLARGKYIARQDADDKSLPERLEKQVQFLEANTDYFLIGTDYEIIDEHSNIIGKPEIPVPINNHEIKAAISKYNTFVHSFVMFRNDVSRIGYFYDTGYKYSQDYELWTRILKHHNAYNLPEVLGLIRTWPGMVSKKNMRIQRKYHLRVKKQFFSKHIINIGFWYYLLKDLSVVYLPRWTRRVYRRLNRKLL